MMTAFKVPYEIKPGITIRDKVGNVYVVGEPVVPQLGNLKFHVTKRVGGGAEPETRPVSIYQIWDLCELVEVPFVRHRERKLQPVANTVD
jgi:hypothetical protein